MFTDIILFLHFGGLMLGAGGGFGSTVVMGIAKSAPPEKAGPLRSVGPALARLSLYGLALMWITGISLVFMKYGGNFSALPQLFWVKILFVLSLTTAAFVIEMTYAAVKRGDAAAAARLPKLGPWAGLSSVLAVLFATLAFH